MGRRVRKPLCFFFFVCLFGLFVGVRFTKRWCFVFGAFYLSCCAVPRLDRDIMHWWLWAAFVNGWVRAAEGTTTRRKKST
jgi:hypothetical protein